MRRRTRDGARRRARRAESSRARTRRTPRLRDGWSPGRSWPGPEKQTHGTDRTRDDDVGHFDGGVCRRVLTSRWRRPSTLARDEREELTPGAPWMMISTTSTRRLDTQGFGPRRIVVMCSSTSFSSLLLVVPLSAAGFLNRAQNEAPQVRIHRRGDILGRASLSGHSRLWTLVNRQRGRAGRPRESSRSARHRLVAES